MVGEHGRGFFFVILCRYAGLDARVIVFCVVWGGRCFSVFGARLVRRFVKRYVAAAGVFPAWALLRRALQVERTGLDEYKAGFFRGTKVFERRYRGAGRSDQMAERRLQNIDRRPRLPRRGEAGLPVELSSADARDMYRSPSYTMPATELGGSNRQTLRPIFAIWATTIADHIALTSAGRPVGQIPRLPRQHGEQEKTVKNVLVEGAR